MTRFFIDRPIFANVIAIVTMVLGVVALLRLPVEQFPQITPPTVQVSAVYPGASSQVVADTVAAPIEQQVNGVEGMLYMSSTCASDGSYKLTVTFDVGTNLDMAQVLVQNRVAMAEPKLPEEVRRQGVTTKKQSTAILQVVTLTSPSGAVDELSLSNYANQRIKDELARIPGVGDLNVFGAAEYGMRIWLDPEKLRARQLTTQDVINAVSEQNVQVAAGQIGQPPAPEQQGFQLTVSTLGRLSRPEQFEQIVVKTGADRRVTYVKDVARVELGAQTYDVYCQKNGKPAAGIAVYLLPGANALSTAHAIREAMVDLSTRFPEGMEYQIPFDTTVFVEEAIQEVYKTLYEAGILVLIVILVFLQDWRAVLVPSTTVPVTIIGAFAAMVLLDFSVNMLTLFGLILAIGIVVDDAIVIVENAAHHIDHGGLAPREATIRAMDEIIGPIIGITVVLMAVFVPTAFLGGITGQLYRQFALTIAATAVISAINALTLKPAQCAVYLRPTPKKKFIFYRWFNACYDVFERGYTAVVRQFVRWSAVAMLMFAALLGATYWVFQQLPTGFLPTEDQGYLIVGVQLPDAASQQRTRAVVEKLNRIFEDTDGIHDWITIGGNSILDGAVASNAATFYVVLEEWAERQKHNRDQFQILNDLRQRFQEIPEAIVFAFPPPAILGLGNTGGFQLQLLDQGGLGLDELERLTQEMVADGNSQAGLRALNSTFRANVPQLYAEVDRIKAKSLDVPLNSVFGTLQAYLGSSYVNDFNLVGRTYQVRVQADAQFRARQDDVRRLEVRNSAGQMVPLGTVLSLDESVGPQVIQRYNLYPTSSVNGEAAPGFSSGEALLLMEQMSRQKLPASAGFAWTGMAFQEKKVGGESVVVFGLAVLLVYLALAAQYESWTSPAAVILVVPLGLLGSGLLVWLWKMDNNVYTQIGLVLIIALASKNAILIVEFARELRHKGMSIVEAAIEAARLRLRPILMTSFAFILGVYPLVTATGAGAASRRALGTAVFGGMLTSTFLAVLFVPVFYVVMQSLSEWWGRKRPAVAVSAGTTGDSAAVPSGETSTAAAPGVSNGPAAGHSA
jgi:hydrophobic/amphiphilic exporter-1 (mainly G- bacteria), HAE1 family